MFTGKELKIRRTILDIKASSIADYLKIHKSYISKMENEVQAIPMKYYVKWVDYLGLNIE